MSGPDREAYRALGLALSHMAHGLVVFDADECVVLCNDRYRELLALPPSLVRTGTPYRAILGMVMASSMAGLDAEGREQRIRDIREQRRALAAGPAGGGQVELRVGERIVSIVHQGVPDGGWVSVLDDVTEQKRHVEQILHLATHDRLTGLGNRALFREQLASALAASRGAILCLDLDRFKHVNDTLGHEAGDGVLVAVADRLRGCLRDTDHVARLGGDEFAVLLDAPDEPNRITAVVERLIADIVRPIRIREHPVSVGVSVGIALFPENGATPDALLRRADLALYRAKREGSGRFRFFEPDMARKPGPPAIPGSPRRSSPGGSAVPRRRPRPP